MDNKQVKLERGAASMVVTLEQGHLIITHGTEGNLLLKTPIPEGTWQGRIWKLFNDLKNENKEVRCQAVVEFINFYNESESALKRKEDNKLIAEFMQWKKVNAGLIGYETPHSVALIKPSDMLFLTDWNWLMPVAQKIEKYLCDNQGKVGYFDECLQSNDLEVRYQAVVEFINFYNESH